MSPICRCLLAAGLAVLCGSMPVFSQTFPSRPMRLIVPFPPGGNADVDARLVADKMSQRLGQPMLVENRSGATSTIGIGALAKSVPDGHMVIGAPAGFSSLLRAGKLRALAVSQAKRTASLPDVPTIAESGVPGYAVDAALALYAPGRTPNELVSRLNAEIVHVLKLPDVSGRIFAHGEEVDPTTPEEQVRVLRSEMEKFGELIKALGMRAER